MVLSTRAKPSGVAQGLKKAHDDDTPLATTIVPPFQQPHDEKYLNLDVWLMSRLGLGFQQMMKLEVLGHGTWRRQLYLKASLCT